MTSPLNLETNEENMTKKTKIELTEDQVNEVSAIVTEIHDLRVHIRYLEGMRYVDHINYGADNSYYLADEDSGLGTAPRIKAGLTKVFKAEVTYLTRKLAKLGLVISMNQD